MTRAFTPSSLSVDIAAITAAAPDMSVFIVSIPPAVLSDKPPESKTTPFPTNASVPRGRVGAYSSRRKRGGRSEPLPTPRTPPIRSRTSCSPANTLTFRPDVRASALATSTTAAGDFSAAGPLIRPRAQPAAGGNREDLAARAVEAGFPHELVERAADRIIDEVRARSEPRAREHGNDEQVGGGRAGNELERGRHEVPYRLCDGRKSPSCQRERVYTRSARRLRYGTTWLSAPSQPARVAATVTRSARRITVRAKSSAAATEF